MMIAQDARILNLLANHPDIFPYINPQSVEYKPENFLLYEPLFEPQQRDRYRFYHNGVHDGDLGATIGMSFQWSSPDVWEMHVMALPCSRGATAIAAAVECLRDMYFKHGTKEVWAQVPIYNKVTRRFCRLIGGRPRGFNHNHLFGKVEVFAATREQWETYLAAKYRTFKEVI